MGVLLNGREELLTRDMEKARVLNTSFTLVFTRHISLQDSEAVKTSGKSRARKSYP